MTAIHLTAPQLVHDFGISCALEFAAWLGVGSIQTASLIVNEAAQANGVLLLDPFHLFRSGGQLSDIAEIDPARLTYAQFCDADATAPETIAGILEEARYDRVLLAHPPSFTSFASFASVTCCETVRSA